MVKKTGQCIIAMVKKTGQCILTMVKKTGECILTMVTKNRTVHFNHGDKKQNSALELWGPIQDSAI